MFLQRSLLFSLISPGSYFLKTDISCDEQETKSRGPAHTDIRSTVDKWSGHFGRGAGATFSSCGSLSWAAGCLTPLTEWRYCPQSSRLWKLATHFQPPLPGFVGNPKAHMEWWMPAGSLFTRCQLALPFSRSLGQGRVSAFLKTGPWGWGWRWSSTDQMWCAPRPAFWARGLLLLLSPLEESISFPDWGQGYSWAQGSWERQTEELSQLDIQISR